MSKVAWDYIVPIKMPKDLKGCEPGKLDTRLLREVSGGKMHHIASYAWEAMVSRAKKEGVVLEPTSTADLYRTYDMQKRAFLTRYVLTDTGSGATKEFEGKTWYKKKGMATLATPGKSNHNLGLAVDVANANGKILNWMIKNVKDFGFSWEVVPEEPWHLRYVCGDDVPAAVLEFAGGVLPAVNISTASTTASDDSVDAKELQQALKDKGFYKGSIDGDIGSMTKQAIRAFKVANKMKDDDIVGPKVKELLGL
jgi:hypothetical protein